MVSNPALSIGADDIKDIFTGDKQFSGPTKIVPVDNSALQADFLAKVMQMSADKYSSLWTKKSFRDGVMPPSVKSGDAEIIAFIKSTPGGVGYISKPNLAARTIQKY